MQKRLTAILIALFVIFAPIAIGERPAEASAGDQYSGPHFGEGNLPPGCVADMSRNNPANVCHHMRTDLNGLDSPKVDVLVMVPVSPTAERDMRIMRQSVEMWEGGIDHLAQEMDLAWLEEGMDFHVSVDYFDPTGDQGGEFTTYPIVDPEIVVIAANPISVGSVGIGIDPVDFVFTNENLVPCHNVENPFDFEHWDNLPGFNNHHEERSGTYVEDCQGKGGNICFAINASLDPDPSRIELASLFDLVSHEFGHCLTIGHVGDGAEGPWGVVPTNDIMAYDSDPPDGTKCVSTLDVEAVASRMSNYLDVNGDAVVNDQDELNVNDPIGVGDPIGEGSNPFQVQHPDDHLYASGSGNASDCPQPDVGLVPGPRTDWTPESDSTTEPELTITSPQNGATVEAGVTDVSGIADLQGGGPFAAMLSGPEEVANGAPATYSVATHNPQGDVTCAITAEGSPTRANESAGGCTVELLWATDGTFTVTGEATDGTSSATDTFEVTVSTPSGFPEPDGSIAGGITIFSDANPVIAHSEAVALGTSPFDPAPKFLPGESATFHTRFTADDTNAVNPTGDSFQWHIWSAAGDLVGTFPCVTAPDSNLTAPNGFDCEMTATLPSDIGRYYTTLQYVADGRWSCHNGGPLDDLLVESGIPDCIKAFDVVVNTSTRAASVDPIGRARASASSPVAVGPDSGERVEIYLDGTTLAGSTALSTGEASPTAEWTVPVDLSGLSGEHTLTGRWMGADGTTLAEQTIAVSIAEPASDRDGDGVPDETDNCPDHANAGQGDMDGDAAGDVCDSDMDGDGRSNDKDSDMDGDGHSNGKEEAHGTDPSDPNSHPGKSRGSEQ